MGCVLPPRPATASGDGLARCALNRSASSNASMDSAQHPTLALAIMTGWDSTARVQSAIPIAQGKLLVLARMNACALLAMKVVSANIQSARTA